MKVIKRNGAEVEFDIVKIISAVFFGNIYNYFIRLGGNEYRVQRITTGNAEDEKYVEGMETGIRFLNCRYFERG